MKKIKLLSVILSIFSLFLFVSCSSSETKSTSYKDGTFTGKSEEHVSDTVGSGYAECVIVIESNTIKSCVFSLYELDGTLKDENYAKEDSKDNYIKAQKAIQAATQYAKNIVEANGVDSLLVISGATITYDECKEAVRDALSKAAN